MSLKFTGGHWVGDWTDEGSQKEKKKTNKPQRNKYRNEASFIPFSIALFFKHFSHRSPGDTIAV